MDNIIEKLENINKFLSLMTNNEQINFLASESNLITELEKNVDTIHQKIICHNLAPGEREQIELNNKKNKIITKSLFPCYWALSEYLDSVTSDSITNYDDYLDDENFDVHI